MGQGVVVVLGLGQDSSIVHGHGSLRRVEAWRILAIELAGVLLIGRLMCEPLEGLVRIDGYGWDTLLPDSWDSSNHIVERG